MQVDTTPDAPQTPEEAAAAAGYDLSLPTGKKWCWTETYKSIVPERHRHGQNWAFCKSNKEIAAMIWDYEVSVVVPDIEHANGGDGPY
jgi:hypothetical protein